MEKKDFSAHTRYAVTLRDEHGRLRPANLYVYRLYDGYMIARRTDGDGSLLKLPYEQMVKIVRTLPVRYEDRFLVPEAMLAESAWKHRTRMQTYSSSPHMGK